MPKTKPRKKPGKKPGAQPGNKNALRHGFYAKNFTKDENERLDLTDKIDVTSEIALIRVCIDRLKDHLSLDKKPDDETLKALNTLSLMTQSISTLTRTHYLIRGRSGDVHDSILRALEELRLEMGL